MDPRATLIERATLSQDGKRGVERQCSAKPDGLAYSRSSKFADTPLGHDKDLSNSQSQALPARYLSLDPAVAVIPVGAYCDGWQRVARPPTSPFKIRPRHPLALPHHSESGNRGWA